MSLFEFLSPTQLLWGILLGYALPALLLSAQTYYLMRCWKSHAREDLPLLAACHFAPGPARHRPWPSRADALPRYLVSVLPLINAIMVFMVGMLFVMKIVQSIINSRRVSQWLRQPL